MEFLISFGSTHRALKTEKVLKEKNILFKLVPTPKNITALCGLSISFAEKDRRAVDDALAAANIRIAALYKKEGDTYVEVQFLRQGIRDSPESGD